MVAMTAFLQNGNYSLTTI